MYNSETKGFCHEPCKVTYVGPDPTLQLLVRSTFCLFAEPEKSVITAHVILTREEGYVESDDDEDDYFSVDDIDSE